MNGFEGRAEHKGAADNEEKMQIAFSKYPGLQERLNKWRDVSFERKNNPSFDEVISWMEKDFELTKAIRWYLERAQIYTMAAEAEDDLREELAWALVDKLQTPKILQ